LQKYQQNKKLITIVIPVFRNEGTLNLTYDHIVKLLPAISENYDCEFIFINDGSDDGSLDELLRIKKMDTRVKVLDFVRNFGQLYAVLAGFEFAKGDLLINISADMQDPPELILEMIKKWEEGYKVVLCARAEREDNFLARITSNIFYGIIKKALPQMPRGGFDYFLLDRIVYKKIFELDERNSFLQGDILWTGYKPNIIHYKRLKRHVGKSQWTIGKKLKYFIDGIINTSYFPIRLMSLIGIIISIIGFSYSGVILFAWFYHKTPFSGYAPIMMGLLTLSGVIMLMIGIVGEYLWRIYDEVRKRPKYLIKNFYTD
jgi:dolichol-phosphate mannosyltransferase